MDRKADFVKNTITLVALVCGLLALAGCKPKADLGFLSGAVPVTGRVTVDGKPLPFASITFFPTVQSAGRTAVAVTAEDGTYEMSTMVPQVPLTDSKGVIPSDYTVVISRVAMPDGTPPPADIIDEADAIAKGAKQLVPTKYTAPHTTPLKVTVASPQTEKNFEL